ncbi:glycine dehydrogenase [Acetobacter pasteurianus NBRC 101655]|uniref:Glycine dehydrogenase (decarboxylating) n=2 Tax=Acetobacter pasteurianus TaxID=438 RepID=C7JFV9_ACEP3|nr:aminomethyl-transferring glycine dehydrogenase [Acetobacter pasteurianus]BAU39500.1 glycine dehydrogenase [Acetobacter pasteurianus NBRC 101655]BAI00529.1 glycine dehydrogenase [Acetobacter pasteurianus IFO 3283-01]BAI03580.1 glycine dehydrogenase [Acetobacter pasteurianus IFO 3283-03]BAI06625.1 glycine dehydrogenase [Acetobacter pasteurianus IFO 3283-07]BAI09675.1 glycine dehydrogenase [Acetobacter pasteurianus IFO 3283-22]
MARSRRALFRKNFYMFSLAPGSDARSQHSLEALPAFAALKAEGEAFATRHIGPTAADQAEMLRVVGAVSLDDLIDQTLPSSIRAQKPLGLGAGWTETQVLARLRELAGQNQVMTSLIGQGYYGTVLPAVIQRNILENPAWYTAYTPYQPEISQGRLEALLNFQTMITELTGLDIANSSLLDEATAAAEAMALARRVATSKSNVFFVDAECLPQTIAVLKTRAEPMGITLQLGRPETDLDAQNVFGAIFQYPGTSGQITNPQKQIESLHAAGAIAVMAADPLALTLLAAPGELGADIAIGSTQRFGIPMGYGGPHAAYMAVRDAYKRSMPGRLVGVSVDSAGRPAYRLALQTREQHIRREKATSNICTAQVLLAVIAGMYAVYHGPEGLKAIAQRIHGLAATLAAGLRALGVTVETTAFFDTLTVNVGEGAADLLERARSAGMNLRAAGNGRIGISLDETSTPETVYAVWSVFCAEHGRVEKMAQALAAASIALPEDVRRQSGFMAQPVFRSCSSETDMLRYLRRLSDKDLALDRTMIPLGSCTMKLNATVEMLPITWSGFCDIHPFAPADQAKGYQVLLQDLEKWLCAISGYDAVSFQPNSGAQGEYAGLLVIRAYHQARGEGHRTVCLIPASAHGTNPASAQMAGMKVVVVKCDAGGNIDLGDMREKIKTHANDLAAVMITYPSTHGVFEENMREICDLVHATGGQVYVDGANMNAQVGLARPADYGGDVSHFNLHKTFCIPHGGGGPGMGPIGVRAHLAPYLPGNPADVDVSMAVSAAPFGSASILPISWAYIRLMGDEGLKRATQVAILNANYIVSRLKDAYPVLYQGAHGRVAHECILDLRPIKNATGVTVDDMSKRLVDYGFHAPTVSFPVAGTFMIEPTESEGKAELDRFCDAMLAMREEVRAVENGEVAAEDAVLRHAPHTGLELTATEWTHPYTRQEACFPGNVQPATKYWPPVGRIDNVYGDRNLVCSCPDIAEWME